MDRCYSRVLMRSSGSDGSDTPKSSDISKPGNEAASGELLGMRSGDLIGLVTMDRLWWLLAVYMRQHGRGDLLQSRGAQQCVTPRTQALVLEPEHLGYVGNDDSDHAKALPVAPRGNNGMTDRATFYVQGEI